MNIELQEAEIQSALSDFYCKFHKVKGINVMDEKICYNVSPFNDFDFKEAQRIIAENNLPLKATLTGVGLFKNDKLIIESL